MFIIDFLKNLNKKLSNSLFNNYLSISFNNTNKNLLFYSEDFIRLKLLFIENSIKETTIFDSLENLYLFLNSYDSSRNDSNILLKHEDLQFLKDLFSNKIVIINDFIPYKIYCIDSNKKKVNSSVENINSLENIYKEKDINFYKDTIFAWIQELSKNNNNTLNFNFLKSSFYNIINNSNLNSSSESDSCCKNTQTKISESNNNNNVSDKSSKKNIKKNSKEQVNNIIVADIKKISGFKSINSELEMLKQEDYVDRTYILSLVDINCKEVKLVNYTLPLYLSNNENIKYMENFVYTTNYYNNKIYNSINTKYNNSKDKEFASFLKDAPFENNQRKEYYNNLINFIKNGDNLYINLRSKEQNSYSKLCNLYCLYSKEIKNIKDFKNIFDENTSENNKEEYKYIINIIECLNNDIESNYNDSNYLSIIKYCFNNYNSYINAYISYYITNNKIIFYSEETAYFIQNNLVNISFFNFNLTLKFFYNILQDLTNILEFNYNKFLFLDLLKVKVNDSYLLYNTFINYISKKKQVYNLFTSKLYYNILNNLLKSENEELVDPLCFILTENCKYFAEIFTHSIGFFSKKYLI